MNNVSLVGRLTRVPEEHALGQFYFYNGIWEIMTRTQLLDGRWLIECRKRD